VAAEWPEPVERVAAVLRSAGVEGRIEEFRRGTPTAEAAAEAAGCRLGQIVKSLVFRLDGGGRYALVMVPGDRRADKAKVAAELAAGQAKPASAEEVVDVTGFEVGGVAPFPVGRVEATLLDRALVTHEVVWVGAGTSRHMAVLAPTDLARVTRARVVDAVSETTI
jgi:prolyl-tRNA editing enzyme YbaK/EbsC (Cys-tRNA(Pro) deacylase)